VDAKYILILSKRNQMFGIMAIVVCFLVLISVENQVIWTPIFFFKTKNLLMLKLNVKINSTLLFVLSK